MQSQNRYQRSAITNDGYYRQKLSGIGEQNAYNEESDLSVAQEIMIIAGLTGTVGSAKVLFDDGNFRSFVHKFITDTSNSQLQDYTMMKDAVDEALHGKSALVGAMDITKNRTIPNALNAAKQARLVQHESALKNVETIMYIKQRYSVLNKITSKEINSAAYETIKGQMNKTLVNEIGLDAGKEVELLRKIGYRHATLQDLVRLEKLDAGSIGMLESLKKEIPDIMKMRADSNILIDNYGRIADTRGFIGAIKRIADDAINEMQIPILGINPLKMFRVDEALNTGNYKKHLFSFIDKTEIQPLMSYRTDELGDDFVQLGKGIYDTVTGKLVRDNMKEASIHSPSARLLRKMTGVQVTTTTHKWDHGIGKLVSELADNLDYGAQPYKYTQAFDMMTPGTWIPSIMSKVVNKTSPLNVSVDASASKAYGKNTKRIFIPQSNVISPSKIAESATPVKEFMSQAADMFGQLGAGRNNMEGITKSTLVPYMLIERINASLEAFGIGLSNKSIGSASDTFVNLMGKRIVPIVAAIGALKYIDYKLEKKDGTSPKDAIMDTVASADVNMAAIREKTGANKTLERLKDLSPGINFIEEIPFIGKLLDTKDKKETEEYWENGSKAIRKGRWWSLGSTPYTGGKVEYFKPNAKRLANSDYKYTDVMYGSKKEYWDNHWLPNLDNPFAPIKHFVTDPYHYEDKHYKDRPYPISGGINELKEIPLIGGFADATLGRVLKPTKKYHEEYWDGDRLVKRDDVIAPWYGEKTTPNLGGSPVPVASGRGRVISDSEAGAAINQALSNVNVIPMTTLQAKQDQVKYGDFTSEGMKQLNPNGLRGAVENMWYDATEIGGFYGFSAASMTTDGLIQKPRLQSADNMMSYQKSFWDKSLGGYGGEISEIFRRFVPNKRYDEKQLEVNTIRNTMPTWMPGEEYFIDFLHGDPYNKVKEGEYRLPGTGYEALHGLKDPTEFWIGSSSLGKSVDDLVKHYLQADDIEIADNTSLKGILASGTATHEEQEKLLEERGKAVASEVYIKDDDAKVEGWIDSIIKDKSSKSGYAIMDIKTINNRGFEKVKQGYGKYENVAQIQWYMHKTGQTKGYLWYMNRDDKSADPIALEYDYDPQFVKDAYKRLSQARSMLNKGLEEGVIQRGDLYDHIDRFRILADVAPYSDNYRYYNKLMSKLPLRDEEKEEVARIRKQVTATKESMRLTPYKFKTANLKYEKVTVKDVLDNGTILTEEYEDNPLKLAGIKFGIGESTDEGVRNMEYLKKHFTPGKKIEIGYDADDKRKVNNDTYKTISVVARENKLNINRDMLKKGYAKEKENDDSPAGIHARYSKNEIAYGKAWETIAHADTYANTKFLQARSALEMYKRKDVYGKDWQDWTEPINDFLIPAAQNVSSKGVISAAILGGIIGSMFGKRGTYARLTGAVIGATTMAGLSAAHKIKENTTGEAYIPTRRKKERELNEYVDVLKYVKNIKLYNQYRKMAIEKEGVDPSQYINSNNKNDDKDASRAKYLESIKRDINSEQIDFHDAVDKTGYKKVEDLKDLKHQINSEINYLTSKKYEVPTSPLATQALMYYNESKKTAYAYEAGDPLQNVLSAFNRKERKYFQPFLDAPEEERKEILKLVPSYMRRPLQSAYGMKVDKKKSLNEYFGNHYLPGDDWAGWSEDVDLDDAKVKMVKHEGMDASEFDIWKDDEIRADHLQIPTPKMDYKQRSTVVKSKLESVLRDSGLSDVSVVVTPSQSSGIKMNFELKEDRRGDIENYINNYGVL